MIIEFQNPNHAIKEYKLVLPHGFTPKPLSGRDEWLAALRSGKFAQSIGFLAGANGHCCLGVLCEVSKEKFEIVAINGTWAKRFGPPGDSQCQSLPPGTLQYRMLESHGKFPPGTFIEYLDASGNPTVAENLIALNDCLRFDFLQIASIIEHLWSHAPLVTYDN